MQDMIKFLNENPVGTLATVEGTTPKVRGWGLMMADSKCLTFQTSNKKNVFKQLIANPQAEFCTVNPETMASVRVSGKVSFVDDLEVKKSLFEKMPQLAAMYGTPDNPEFEVFTLRDGEMIYSDFSGEPSKTVKY